MKGRRLDDSPIGQFPVPYDELQPGDYWKVLTYEGDRPLDVLNHAEDRTFWGSKDDPRFAGNLTGGVWGVMTPAVGKDSRSLHGMLSIHTVREHEDGTITVAPGDGSSNSILVKRREDLGETWHGYIDHGVWREC